MENLEGTTQGFLIKSYYNFLCKLYGEKKVPKNEEFENLVAQKFGNEPNKDIDIEVILGYKTKSGKKMLRKPRSLIQFVENKTGVLPEDTTHIKFYGEFVERNNNDEKVRADKKKDKFAFQEQIQIVKNIENKNLSKKDLDVKKFEKEDVQSFSDIIKFEDLELML